jgi:predicted RNase H-like HicB family nuclease
VNVRDIIDAEEYPGTGRLEMKYAVVYEKTDTGYSSYVPDLPGCIAAAATRQRTAALMRGAIEMHLSGMREDGDPIPKPKTVADYIEIPQARTIVGRRPAVLRGFKPSAESRAKPSTAAVRRSKRRKIS